MPFASLEGGLLRSRELRRRQTSMPVAMRPGFAAAGAAGGRKKNPLRWTARVSASGPHVTLRCRAPAPHRVPSARPGPAWATCRLIGAPLLPLDGRPTNRRHRGPRHRASVRSSMGQARTAALKGLSTGARGGRRCAKTGRGLRAHARCSRDLRLIRIERSRIDG